MFYIIFWVKNIYKRGASLPRPSVGQPPPSNARGPKLISNVISVSILLFIIYSITISVRKPKKNTMFSILYSGASLV